MLSYRMVGPIAFEERIFLSIDPGKIAVKTAFVRFLVVPVSLFGTEMPAGTLSASVEWARRKVELLVAEVWPK